MVFFTLGGITSPVQPTFRTSPYDFPEFDMSPVCQAQGR
jgi:hypothetical protein